MKNELPPCPHCAGELKPKRLNAGRWLCCGCWRVFTGSPPPPKETMPEQSDPDPIVTNRQLQLRLDSAEARLAEHDRHINELTAALYQLAQRVDVIAAR